MLRTRLAAPLVALTVLAGLLAGCSAGPSQAEQYRANLQATIDAEVAALMESSPDLPFDEAIAMALNWLYTDAVPAEDLLALGYTPDQLLRGATQTQCLGGGLPQAVTSLAAVGIGAVEFATACLATGVPEQALADTGAFSAAELAAAERPGVPGGSSASSVPEPWVTAMTFPESQEVCRWLREFWADSNTQVIGSNGLQKENNPGAYIECSVVVRAGRLGPAELTMSFRPPDIHPTSREYRHCSGGTFVTQFDSDLIDDAGGAFLGVERDRYSYCINSTEISFRTNSRHAPISFPDFVQEALDKLRGEGAGRMAKIVERFETPQ